MGNLTRCPHCSGLIMIEAQQSIQVKVEKFSVEETLPKKETLVEENKSLKKPKE